MHVLLMMPLLEAKQMQLLLNVGGADRVSREQMAMTVAHIKGYDSSFIKPVSASSVSVLLWFMTHWFGVFFD